jgi:diguanylate cyclase (GGDEF)-like protein
VAHKSGIPLFNDKSEQIGKGEVAASGLWDGNKFIGYIAADNLLTKKQFKPDQLKILVLYAQIIGTLGNRIRTAEAIQRNAREQRLLNDITQTTIQQTDYKVMLQILADRMGEIFRADGCYITLWDEDTQKVTPGTAYGPFKRQFITDKSLLAEVIQLMKIVFETGTVFVAEDVFRSKSISRTMTHRLSIRGVITLPLIANNVRLGAVTISFNQPRQFKSDEIDLGEKAAQQIALAILKNRLLEAAQTRAKEAMTLQQASAAVVSTLHRDEALERILEELNRVVPYDTASVQLLNGNELEIVGGRGFMDIEAVLGLRFSLEENSPNAIVFEKGEPVIIVDAPQKFAAFKSPPHDHIHGWMGVPLKAHEELIGMLALDSCEAGKFTNDHRRLAAAFADQVAIALENSRLFEETQWLAIHDSLTGLYNRRHFMLLAEKEFERAKRYGASLSAIMLDIDHFKRVNDSRGHLTGDQVLQQIATICNKNLRSHDLIGRYGGEEFIILLPETSATSQKINSLKGTKESEPAKTVAERLRKEVERLKLDGLQDDFQVTISLGIAEISPQIEDVEQLIDHADQGLLVAKNSGRNRVVHWSNDEVFHERQPE